MAITPISNGAEAQALSLPQRIAQIPQRVWAAVKSVFQWIASFFYRAPAAQMPPVQPAPPMNPELFRIFLQWHKMKAARSMQAEPSLASAALAAYLPAPPLVRPSGSSSAAAAAAAAEASLRIDAEKDELLKRAVSGICIGVLVYLGYLKDMDSATQVQIVNEVISQGSDVYTVLNTQYRSQWTWRSYAGGAESIAANVAKGSETLLKSVIDRVMTLREEWKQDPTRRRDFLQSLFRNIADEPGNLSPKAETVFKTLGIQMDMKILGGWVDLSSTIQAFAIKQAQTALNIGAGKVAISAPALRYGFASAFNQNGPASASNASHLLIQGQTFSPQLQQDFNQAIEAILQGIKISDADRALAQTLLSAGGSSYLLNVLDNALCDDALFASALRMGNKNLAAPNSVTEEDAVRERQAAIQANLPKLQGLCNGSASPGANLLRLSLGSTLLNAEKHLCHSHFASRLYTWLLSDGLRHFAHQS
jgi:hypothetical protein